MKRKYPKTLSPTLFSGVAMVNLDVIVHTVVIAIMGILLRIKYNVGHEAILYLKEITQRTLLFLVAVFLTLIH